MSQDVVARVEGSVGRLTLNRPEALHALNTAICVAMTETLLTWRSAPAVTAILLDHSGERGFCAGGDIRMLAESGAKDGAAAREFFFIEYRLNDLLRRYLKPVIVIMDGVTMGGGVGLSMPAKYRVATERTIFAMPETGIGLFPDVGGGWHLPRSPGKTGLWLALTGARLRAADCLALGIATHFVESADVAALKDALLEEPAAIDAVLARFANPSDEAPIADRRADIDRLFAGETVESIFASGVERWRMGGTTAEEAQDQVATDPEGGAPTVAPRRGHARVRRQHGDGIPNRGPGGRPARLYRGRESSDRR